MRSQPLFRRESCVRYRFRYSACERCAEACPHGAIRPGDDGIELDAEGCRNCALCAGACPTEALVAGNFSAEAILRKAEGLERLAVSCAPSGLGADAIVPCLGALEATLLATLAGKGVALEIRGAEHCADCEHGPVGLRRLEAQLVASRWLRDATAPATWAEASLSSPPSVAAARPWSQATAHDGSRRQLFRRIFGKGLNAVAQAANPPASVVPAPLKAVRVASPVAVKRRERLQALLPGQRRECADLAAHEDLPCASLELDAAKCTVCEACARVCPTGALQVAESGVAWALSFRASRCVGCGVCVEACQSHALAMSAAAPAARLGASVPATLHSLAKSRCPRCNRFFLSGDGAGHCAICRGDDEDFDALFG